MSQSQAIAVLSKLAAKNLGVFRGRDAVARGVTRKQLTALGHDGSVIRVLPDTYRMAAVPVTDEQWLRAALLWAGDLAAADGRSAGASYQLRGVRAHKPEINVPRGRRLRSPRVVVREADDRAALMLRSHLGVRLTGPEATLVQLAHLIDDESLEIACEDARRRQLVTMASLAAYLERHARPGRRGIAAMRKLLSQLDPDHPSRSDLEVKARRLLVAHGIDDFVREHPLEGRRCTYYFDFAFLERRTILETNGRKWHDDPVDYEWNNEKWSVPGQHGFKLVMATWDKVTKRSGAFIDELTATLHA